MTKEYGKGVAHFTYATVYDQNNIENEYVLPINDSWTESLPLPPLLSHSSISGLYLQMEKTLKDMTREAFARKAKGAG
jgi:hypothetical protein